MNGQAARPARTTMDPGATLRVGCSGWQYRHWRGDFYPPALPQTRWLEHYAAVFDTVEVNATFYRLPDAATFRRWRARAPAGFVFAVKASRYLTHVRRLRDPAEALERLFARARLLGDTLGPVLYQLPPRWRIDLDRLAAFLDAVPRDALQAIEFRDPSWYDDATFALLERSGVALCLHDLGEAASPRRAVGPFLYVRFHGSVTQGGGYTDAALRDWAAWLSAQAREGRAVYAYFNNDVGGHAPRNAATLRRLLRRALGLGD